MTARVLRVVPALLALLGLVGAQSLESLPVRRSPWPRAFATGDCTPGTTNPPDQTEVYSASEPLAENFEVFANVPLRAVDVWGSSGNTPGADDFTVRVRFDTGGLPGAILYAESGVASSRATTGETVGVVDEYVYTLTLAAPPVLTPGTYWLEVHNDTPGVWSWESGAGPADSAFFLDDPGVWLHPGFALAFSICVGPPVTEVCRTLDFRTGDSGQALVHGQHLGNGDTEFDGGPAFPVTITSALASSGLDTAAILDSNGAPAAQDPDLQVGKGNILILQTDANLAQCPPGSDRYCSHNDDEGGGTLSFAFHGAATLLSVVLVDIDATDGVSTVVLTDASGATRTYVVPPGWTGDLVFDGPPGFGLLDLTTLLDQPGFASTVTASEEAGFDPLEVTRLDVHLGGSGALDDLSWCSRAPRVGAPRPWRALELGRAPAFRRPSDSAVFPGLSALLRAAGRRGR